MISRLRGTLLHAAGHDAVIEVGGVGFSVQLTPQHALSLRVGSECVVMTSLIVREDSLTLFGFVDQQSLDVFTLLVGVTGVGPKSAMAVLAELSAEEIAHAVDSDDDSVFRRVSGIGPKTAKLIVLSLSGKVTPVRSVSQHGTERHPVRDAVLAALVGLGWNERSAMAALDQMHASGTDIETRGVQAVLREALSQLGPRTITGEK